VNIQALPPQVFFECKGIRNLFLQAKWLTCIITGRFCNIWRSNTTKIWNNGRTTTSSFTTIKHQHTASVQQFFTTKNMAVVSHAP
jgi:hypothetical protein